MKAEAVFRAEAARRPAEDISMPTKQMTYAELGAAWGITAEAARKRVEGLRLPRQPGNDGRTRVVIDLDEVTARPPQPSSARNANPSGRRAPGDRPETEALRLHVASLQAEVQRLTILATTHRADFERERSQAEQAVADLTALAGRLADAEQDRATQRIEAEQARMRADQAEIDAEAVRAELTAWRALPWWRRALG